MGTLKLTDRTSKNCWQIEVFTSLKLGELKLKKEQKSALKADITSKTIASLSEYFINGFRCGFCSRSSRKSQRSMTVFLVKSQVYFELKGLRTSANLLTSCLHRSFKSHNVTIFHKPFNSLTAQLVHVKDIKKTLRSAEQFITSGTNNETKKCWFALSCHQNKNRNHSIN